MSDEEKKNTIKKQLNNTSNDEILKIMVKTFTMIFSS